MKKNPFKHCELYKERTCCHIDMPNCIVETCLLRKEYLKYKDRKLFWLYFDKNLIYCEDTHSFIHRLCKKLNIKEYKKAQHLAFEVIKEMEKDYNKDKNSNEEMIIKYGDKLGYNKIRDCQERQSKKKI